MKALPYLRPRVLYVFGAKSLLFTHEEQGKKFKRMGIGAGGSGGATEGMVKGHTSYEASDALLIFEQLVEIGRAATDWV